MRKNDMIFDVCYCKGCAARGSEMLPAQEFMAIYTALLLDLDELRAARFKWSRTQVGQGYSRQTTEASDIGAQPHTEFLIFSSRKVNA